MTRALTYLLLITLATGVHVAAAIHLSQDSTSLCPADASCTDCTRIRFSGTGDSAGCGYCDGKCVVSAENGPVSGANCTRFQWDRKSCGILPTNIPNTPSPTSIRSCDYYKDCWSCAAAKGRNGGGCGWCAASGKCEFGTSSGPLGASCSSWDWTANQCPSPPTPAPTQVPIKREGIPFIPIDKSSIPSTTTGGNENFNRFVNESIGGPIYPSNSAGAFYDAGSPTSMLIIDDFIVAQSSDALDDNSCHLNITLLNATSGNILRTARILPCPTEPTERMVPVFTKMAVDTATKTLYAVASHSIWHFNREKSSLIKQTLHQIDLMTLTSSWSEEIAGADVSISEMLFTVEQGTPIVQWVAGQVPTEYSSSTNLTWSAYNVTNPSNPIPMVKNKLIQTTVPGTVKLVHISDIGTVFVQSRCQLALFSAYYGFILYNLTYANVGGCSAGGGVINSLSVAAIPEQSVVLIAYSTGTSFPYGSNPTQYYTAVKVGTQAGTILYTVNFSVPLAGYENPILSSPVVATDGKVFWTNGVDETGTNSGLLVERDVLTGAVRSDSVTFGQSNQYHHCYVNAMTVTLDYIFAACSPVTVKSTGNTVQPLSAWRRSDGEHLNFDEIATSGPAAMIYKGGWLFFGYDTSSSPYQMWQLRY